MTASPRSRGPRHLLGLASSGAVVVALVIGGCGPSESVQELTPEAKKSLVALKVGDTSKFVKPKARPGKRR
jgi:hypothetical protein